jgi:hypothetical protein
MRLYRVADTVRRRSTFCERSFDTPCCPGHDGRNGAERDRQGGKGLPPFSRPNQGIFGDQIGEITRCCGRRRTRNAVIFPGGQSAACPSCSMRQKRFALAFINDGSDPVDRCLFMSDRKPFYRSRRSNLGKFEGEQPIYPCKIGIISQYC